MAEFPFLPIDVRAFLADTQHLDARETGAYAMLLFHAWLVRDNGLPDDDRRLALLARCAPAEWRRIRPTVMGYFFLSRDGRWHQKRLDTTKMEVATKSAKASAAANARWLKWLQTRRADADSQALLAPSERIDKRNANHNQNHKLESLSENLTDAARGAAQPGSSAPRATAKGQASGPTEGSAIGPASHETWRQRLANYDPHRIRQTWHATWGPRPDAPGLQPVIPPDLLAAWRKASP